jgi:hypothetical protein
MALQWTGNLFIPGPFCSLITVPCSLLPAHFHTHHDAKHRKESQRFAKNVWRNEILEFGLLKIIWDSRFGIFPLF